MGGYSVPIDIVHAERLDAMLPQNLLLAFINIPQADVHQFLQIQSLFLPQPPEHVRPILPRQPGEESNRHAVDVPTLARLRCVDVRVRVHPDHRHLPAQPLPDGPRRARDGPDGDGMVPAQRQHQPAVLGVLVHLVGQLLGDGADGERVFHVAVVRVRSGLEARVIVDRVVVVEGVA